MRDPHAAHVRIIGISSLAVINRSCDRLSHCTWNQEVPCHAPHPHAPEAPDAISTAAYRLGTESLMGKFDVEAAYRQIPVHRLLQAV